MSHTAFGRRPLFRTGILIVGFCGLLLSFWVKSAVSRHGRSLPVYPYKPTIQDTVRTSHSGLTGNPPVGCPKTLLFPGH
jgi:hypothetical protein